MRLFVHHVRQFGPHSAMTPKVFVNHGGKGSSCALHWAAECSKFESIEFLLQQGADPEAKDDTGGTAIEYVINNASRQPSVLAQVIRDLEPAFSELGNATTCYFGSLDRDTLYRCKTNFPYGLPMKVGLLKYSHLPNCYSMVPAPDLVLMRLHSPHCLVTLIFVAASFKLLWCQRTCSIFK
jgi:hypothetical protein